MSLTTDNGKMSVMDWQSESEPGLLISVTSFDTAEKQGLVWGVTEVTFGGPSAPERELIELEPERGSGGASGWNSSEWRKQAKRRRELLKEDEEILAMCMAALPQLLEKLNG